MSSVVTISLPAPPSVNNLTEPPRSREWWDEESVRTGTDWRTLIEQRQDALRLMATECPTCGCSPCPTPSFCAVCREADQRKVSGERPQYVAEWTDWPEAPDRIPADWDSPTVSLDALFNSRSGTPRSTVEAILYCVRARGVAALKESANVERLARCDRWARAGIDKQIKKIARGGDQCQE